MSKIEIKDKVFSNLTMIDLAEVCLNDEIIFEDCTLEKGCSMFSTWSTLIARTRESAKANKPKTLVLKNCVIHYYFTFTDSNMIIDNCVFYDAEIIYDIENSSSKINIQNSKFENCRFSKHYFNTSKESCEIVSANNKFINCSLEVEKNNLIKMFNKDNTTRLTIDKDVVDAEGVKILEENGILERVNYDKDYVYFDGGYYLNIKKVKFTPENVVMYVNKTTEKNQLYYAFFTEKPVAVMSINAAKKIYLSSTALLKHTKEELEKEIEQLVRPRIENLTFYTLKPCTDDIFIAINKTKNQIPNLSVIKYY